MVNLIMGKKALVAGIVSVLALIGLIYALSLSNQNEIAEDDGTTRAEADINIVNEEAPVEENEQESTNMIRITESGFEPNNIEINIGERITFINEKESEAWPASDAHPTHTFYPGSSIRLCGTSKQSEIFDACRGFAKGESWTFTFIQRGTWKYHDHLDSGTRGVIAVN